MNSTTSAPTRKRRRLIAWLSFAAVGLATGAVWATGSASVGGATGTNGSSPIVAPSAPGAHTPDLQGAVTAGSPLTVDWTGRWGATASTNFFTVDLSGESVSRTYNVAFLRRASDTTGPSPYPTFVATVDRAS